MRTVITTVGTSLLTNRRDDRPWKDRNRNDPYPDADTVGQWMQTANPVAISAETHVRTCP